MCHLSYCIKAWSLVGLELSTEAGSPVLGLGVEFRPSCYMASILPTELSLKVCPYFLKLNIQANIQLIVFHSYLKHSISCYNDKIIYDE